MIMLMDQDDVGGEEATNQINLEDEQQINISDVIEVIRTTDPAAQDMFNNVNDVNNIQSPPIQQQQQQPQHQQQLQQNTHNGRGGGGQNNLIRPAEISAAGAGAAGGVATPSPAASSRRNAKVVITEQPASKALRFRYECEGRSAGSIPGINTSPENKTFPSIKVVGCQRRAVVVVSCVTKDPPYRPHPHNLVGKEGCKKGVCTVEINSETMSVTFSNLGIQCVKRKDIEEALRVREEIRVDPFRTGFDHRSQPSSIDLNSVRLCFQVFLESDHLGRFTVPLPPEVSEPIFDKKAMSDLVICKLSDASCTVAGGKEMILLCEKVAKEDISVRFFEETNGNLLWEGFGEFQHTNVHKQVAISFRTPRYRSLEIEQPVKCWVQLRRPSDGVTSESLPFEFNPLDSDVHHLKRKRQKIERQQQDSCTPGSSMQTKMEPIKTEPLDGNSPHHYNNYSNASPSNRLPVSPAPPTLLNQSPFHLSPPQQYPIFQLPYSSQFSETGTFQQHHQQQQQQQHPDNFTGQHNFQEPQQQYQSISFVPNIPVTRNNNNINNTNNNNNNNNNNNTNNNNNNQIQQVDTMDSASAEINNLLNLEPLSQMNSSDLSHLSSLLNDHYPQNVDVVLDHQQQQQLSLQQPQQHPSSAFNILPGSDEDAENMTDSFKRAINLN